MQLRCHIARYHEGVSVIVELRAAAGVSQRELARRSGVAQPNIAAYESGRRTPSEQMVRRLATALAPPPRRTLAAHREEVIAILRRHGLTRPRVFGSVARGEDRPGSDIDLVVDMAATGDILDLIDAGDELEALLGCHVDLVTSRSLRPGHEIERSALPL